MTGCTFKRKLKSGVTWGYAFYIGRDAAGKRIQIFKSGFPTKGAAAQACNAAIAEYETANGKISRELGLRGRTWAFALGDIQAGGFISPEAAEVALTEAREKRAADAEQLIEAHRKQGGPTYASYFQEWIDEHVARRCAPKTTERYRELGKYLIAHLGETPLNELTTAQIQRTIHDLEDHGGALSKAHPEGRPLAPKTVRHIGTLLFTSLSEADRLGCLTIPHPMANKRVLLPKLSKKKPTVLDPAKLGVLFEKARGTRLYPFVIAAVDSGCRRGELLALQWPDLNNETGELNVSKSLEQTKAGGLRIKSTKSGEPRRFPISEWAVEVLQTHRQEQNRDRELYGPDYQDNHLIFCQPNGTYYSPDRVGARVVELMRKAGLPGVSLHSLRHSNASISISNGVPIAVVSERLGHADQNITLAIYNHALPADTRAATAVWSNAMSDVIAASRKAGATGILADTCRGKAKKLQVLDSTDKELAGTTGLEPDKKRTG